MNCTPIDHSRSSSTFRCPHRQDSWISSMYANTMIRMYQGTERDLFTQCIGLPIPMNDSSPEVCWPRLIILASWPTSGSTLIRNLLQTMTIPMEIAMHEYEERDQLLYSIEKGMGNRSLQIFGSVKRPVALPLLGRALIFKSHTGSETNGSIGQEENAHQIQQARRLGRLHGIIRLARNPGDHILRNRFRWGDPTCYRMGDDCFFEKAGSFCKDMVDEAHNYNAFHDFWWDTVFHDENDFPQIIAHQEDFTSVVHASETVVKLLKFTNSLVREMDYRQFITQSRVNDMLGRIKEPTYEHGTLLTRICGKETSRLVHSITSDASDKLGYRFNHKAATWKLARPQ
ncbi:unnamed protein product [Cylindrotheca closterium]|uniref:Uncharacterized protein n=1 Tax=Cylindrotheca closterium TaxID=2856 RepID=A0AAD2CTQ2_9STRA|nr:unnamed protein product [Cylindrotheca closterium]